MIITEQEKITKIQRKLTEAPELRRFTITMEGNLLMEGNRKIICEEFHIISPRGTFWHINGNRYPVEVETQEAIPIGLITEKKLLINAPFDHYCYVSPNHPPQDDDLFLSLVFTSEFSEFIYFDSNMNAPLRLLVNSSKQEAIAGLAVTLTKLHNKTQGEHLKFHLEQEVER